jgi:hypothetical protein
MVIIFTGFIMFSKDQSYHPSEGEQLVNSLLPKAAGIIQDKYKIRPCGVGVSMPGGPIQKVALCFDTSYPYSKEKLRELLINSAHELLNQVQKNKEIQKFIKEPPFTIKNVQIIIYNHDKDGRELRDPEISVAEISQGGLNYQTIDPQDSFKYKIDFSETYEEALKILEGS